MKDKKKFLIKLRLNFPDLPISYIEKNLIKINILELKKELIKMKINFGH